MGSLIIHKIRGSDWMLVAPSANDYFGYLAEELQSNPITWRAGFRSPTAGEGYTWNVPDEAKAREWLDFHAPNCHIMSEVMFNKVCEKMDQQKP
jgi:hypothetical protein